MGDQRVVAAAVLVVGVGPLPLGPGEPALDALQLVVGDQIPLVRERAADEVSRAGLDLDSVADPIAAIDNPALNRPMRGPIVRMTKNEISGSRVAIPSNAGR